MHVLYLCKVPYIVIEEPSKTTSHYTATNEGHTPQHKNNPIATAIVTKSPIEKEQEKVSTTKEKSSKGKTSSSSTTAKKRRVK